MMPQVQSLPPPQSPQIIISQQPPPPPSSSPTVHSPNFQGYGRQQQYNTNNNYINDQANVQYVNPNNINNNNNINLPQQLITANNNYNGGAINGHQQQQTIHNNNNFHPIPPSFHSASIVPSSGGNVYANGNNGQQQQQMPVNYNNVLASNSQYNNNNNGPNNNNGNNYNTYQQQQQQQPAGQYATGQQPQQQIVYQPVAVQPQSNNNGGNNYNQGGNSNYNTAPMSNNYNNNSPVQGYQEVTAAPNKGTRSPSSQSHQADQMTSNEDESYNDQDSPRPYTGAAQTYENSKRPSYSDSSRSKNTEAAYDQEPAYETETGAEEVAYRPSKSKKSSGLSMAGYEEIPASELYGSSRGGSLSSLSGSSSLYKGMSDGDEYNLESLTSALGSSSSPYSGMGMEGGKLSSVYPEGSELSPFSEYESAFGGSDVSGLSSNSYGSSLASSSSTGSPSAASLYSSSLHSPFGGSGVSSPDLSLLFATSGMKMPRGTASFLPSSFASSSSSLYPSSSFGLRPSSPSYHPRPYPSASSMYPVSSPYAYGRPSMRRPTPHYGMAPSNYYKVIDLV